MQKKKKEAENNKSDGNVNKRIEEGRCERKREREREK